MKYLFYACLCLFLLCFSCAAAENGTAPASPEEMGTTHLDQIDPAVRAKWIDELIAFAETEYKKNRRASSVCSLQR